jgi:hypothetical protein
MRGDVGNRSPRDVVLADFVKHLEQMQLGQVAWHKATPVPPGLHIQIEILELLLSFVIQVVEDVTNRPR